mmetsp:Transcript_26565/g.84267  ORF Transcript_26565/g.84267 Transcript_26565/m.84267 type:complete len:257 (-) Transcript_26565:97-867(-)
MPRLRPMELLDELLRYRRQAEVDECIPNVALAIEVNRQVDKVILTLVALVQPFNQHVPRVAIRNVPKHDSSVAWGNAAVHRHGRRREGHAVEIRHERRVHRRHAARVGAGLELLRQLDPVRTSCRCLLRLPLEELAAAAPRKPLCLLLLAQRAPRDGRRFLLLLLRRPLLERHLDFLLSLGVRRSFRCLCLCRRGGGRSAAYQLAEPDHRQAVVAGPCGWLQQQWRCDHLLRILRLRLGLVRLALCSFWNPLRLCG